MLKMICTLFLVLVLPSVVQAQDKATAGKSKVLDEARGPAPAPLSEEERKIMDIGEISNTRYIIGGVLGTYPIGLGLGHAVQGRYSDKGWIFTVGELASLAVLATGVGNCADTMFDTNDGRCRDGGLIGLGIISYVGFRLWEIFDVWITPLEHNRRYQQIKARQSVASHWQGFVAPTQDGGRFVLQWGF